MKIHEYQAKAILRAFGVAVPAGEVVTDASEVPAACKKIGGDTFVVKAQIHAGGRGKGGGVKIAKRVDEAVELTKKMLGMKLVTHQTGPEGKKVGKVLIEQGINIVRELYLGIVIDRVTACPVIMASEAGGMEIEEVAASTPELILKEAVDPAVGFRPYQARKLAFGMKLTGPQVRKAEKLLGSLYNAFRSKDCSLAEINPLVITAEDDVMALDAKMNFDDSGLFRQGDVVEMRDLTEEDPLEIEASEHDLNYIKLDGNVGCMVNGAGLAMATMDLIKLAGGEPANFLDVGGTASVERVSSAFKILVSDKKVKAVLINIFGGIVRCDRVAGGVIEALKVVRVDMPVVIRLQGTNADEAREILNKSDLEFLVADTLKEAADQVVKALGN